MLDADMSPDQPVTLLGIDPDASGAVAVLQWGPTTTRTPKGAPAVLSDATVEVHDMPVIVVPMAKRNRRQSDAAGIAALVQQILPMAADKSDARVILEEATPNSLNGKQSWWSTGFAFGVWNGVLHSFGMQTQTISARRWKYDMGLNKKGKEGSRQLALRLFPQAAHLLKRKKDHGRAEALLLAAWASGIPLPLGPFEEVIGEVDIPSAGALDPDSDDAEDGTDADEVLAPVSSGAVTDGAGRKAGSNVLAPVPWD